MEAAIKVSYQVLIIFLYISLGFIFTKSKKINNEGVKQMTSLLLILVTPCVLIESYQNKIDFLDFSLLKDLGIAALLTIFFHFLAIVLSTFLFKKEDTGRYKLNIFTSIYSNCGFMGIPLLKSVLGDDGVFFGSAYLAMFTIISWTHGIYVFTESKKSIAPKSLLTNPGVMGSVIALLLFLFKIKLPSFALDAVSGMASLNTPLSMIILGSYLASINIKTALLRPTLYASSFLRLILVPALCLASILIINILYPLNPTLSLSVLIPAACPSAAIAALFSTKYGNDAGYATEIVAVTTLLSIATIPLIIFVSALLLK